MKIEVSNDQTNWTTAAENTDGSVYAWKKRLRRRCRQIYPHHIDVRRPRHQRVRAQKRQTAPALQRSLPSPATLGSSRMSKNTVPLYPSYMNSTYFDEIYHAPHRLRAHFGTRAIRKHTPHARQAHHLGRHSHLRHEPVRLALHGHAVRCSDAPCALPFLKAPLWLHVPLHRRYRPLCVRFHALRPNTHRDHRYLRRVLHHFNVRRHARVYSARFKTDSFKSSCPRCF